MKLFDTMSRTEQVIQPMDGKTLRFYCCGPTVYGPAHVGNFRTFLLQDVFRRTLEADGMLTFHVRNITDIDDKTIRQSQAEGRTLTEFTQFWTNYFHTDCQALNMLKPHAEPNAVAYIPQLIDMIERLVKQGHAYVSEGSVYFRVASFSAYGRLSHLSERELMPNQNSTSSPQDADEYDKETAADFALWKALKPEDGTNFWSSPWGEGRPGWHIECSAMSTYLLGDTFDVHAGGVDLIFPHHENEIAQSEACTCKPFCKHWFHISHLMIEGKKMSKSLGNLYTLEDIRKRGHTPAETRYVIISGHYRQSLNFTWDTMSAAHSALEKLAKFDQEFTKVCGDQTWAPGTPGLGVFQPAWDALNDDLNTAKALGSLFTGVKEVEALLKKGDCAGLTESWYGWKRILYALGLMLPSLEASTVETPAEIKKLADERWAARNAKDWAKADVLRKELTAAGWSMKDGRDGYELTPLQQ